MALLKIALLHLIVLAAREKGGLEQEEKGGDWATVYEKNI